MPKIYFSNKKCQIVNETNHKLLQALSKELSYRVQGAEYTRAYKGYIDSSGKYICWDGFNRLMTNNLSFPRGLLQRVISFYKDRGIDVELENKTPFNSNYNSIDISDKLKQLGKEPYFYQLDAVEVVKKEPVGILRMATGSGKSITMALMTAALNKSTIIYVIGKDLLYQLHDLFKSLFDIPIGIIGDGLCSIGEINIASIWTVGQAIGLKSQIAFDSDDEKKIDPSKYSQILKLMKDAKVHVFDECHVAACDTIQGINDFIEPEHIYGMSASPWRDDGADLLIECVLGQKIVDVPASLLIEKGFLVKPIIKFVPVPEMKGKKPYQTIYKNYIVENEKRNALVVKAAQKLVEQGYQTLVLYNSLNHGNELFRLISEAGVPAAILSGKDSLEIRNNVKKDLESGKIKCIVASRIFDIGVDLPTLSGLVIASSGKSSVRALQRIGRVIRKAPGKKFAAIIDFIDQAKFLIDHSEARYKIYKSEPQFEVHYK